jgi:REP element-mobilizing transposase RayT
MWHGRPERKPNRLPADCYVGNTPVSLVLNVRRRAKAFASSTIASVVERWIRNTAITERRELHAYCVMPDHVHVIVVVDTRDQMSNYASRLKNDVTRALKEINVRFTWQKGFWDSALYDAREYDVEVKYVLDNPRRAGLVAAWHEYPHSFAIDIPKP